MVILNSNFVLLGGYSMRLNKYVIVFTVIMTVIGTMIGTTHGAPKPEVTKDWNISFLGTMQVPAQLEIVDGQDVLGEIVKLGEKMNKSQPVQDGISKVPTISPADIAEAFTNNNIGVYQLALKNNGSYNIGMVFVGKVPAQYNSTGLTYFDKLKNTNQQQQEEIHKLILKGINDVYTKEPDLQNIFQLEILEFYPFQQIDNTHAQIISVGGSVAVRTFKLIQPFALKTYIINKNSDIYIFGILNSGPDRKIWDDMTQKMLSTARWNWL